MSSVKSCLLYTSNTGNRAWDGDFRVAYLDRSLPETADAPRDRMGAKPISTCLLYTSRCV